MCTAQTDGSFAAVPLVFVASRCGYDSAGPDLRRRADPCGDKPVMIPFAALPLWALRNNVSSQNCAPPAVSGVHREWPRRLAAPAAGRRGGPADIGRAEEVTRTGADESA